MEAKELLTALLALQRKYATTPRVMVTRERYDNVIKRGLLTDVNLEDNALREHLIEHIGHLPIIAAFLHPYIEHTNKVDLGKSLIMLAIHDIGETEVGDMLLYNKTEDHRKKEREATQRILHNSLKPYYEEFESLETNEAKFAESVDKLAPILHDIDDNETTLPKFKQYNFTAEDVRNKKLKYFQWDSVLLEIFNHSIEAYETLERRHVTK